MEWLTIRHETREAPGAADRRDHPSELPAELSGLREDWRTGSSLEDFKRAAKAPVKPVKVRYIKRPNRL